MRTDKDSGSGAHRGKGSGKDSDSSKDSDSVGELTLADITVGDLRRTLKLEGHDANCVGLNRLPRKPSSSSSGDATKASRASFV
jgi:hypothetical protein